MEDPVQVNRTGLVSTLGPYAASGYLLLIGKVDGVEADEIRHRMAEQSRLVTSCAQLLLDVDVPVDPPRLP